MRPFLPLGRHGWAATCAALLLACPAAARATTMVSMSIAELAREAELVAVVEGVRGDAFFHDAQGTKISTQVHMRVHEVWKGQLPAGIDHIDVVTLGGPIGDIAQVVPGAARLPVGRPMILFVRRAPSHTGEFEVLGLGQGAWHLDADRLPLGPETRVSQSDLHRMVGGRQRDPDAHPKTVTDLRRIVREGLDEHP